ncbi:hypothetical protein M501DRAFT_177100 [Patellaria atrata CBS 101060]|uniref:Cep57 centrosome microtubule-binding domain-containing protein n=1 Tax=Patellaria atrata CBS 101060 TaxID=1346257 RepID=A0A9P4VPS5_9PEZI|nr:hypothetical protein M501DRAFT_177100 [Patellaria atrata CBS 101060]
MVTSPRERNSQSPSSVLASLVQNIHENRSRNQSYYLPSSPPKPPQEDLSQVSSLDPDDIVAESTRNQAFEESFTDPLPGVRDSAKRYHPRCWQPRSPPPKVTSSFLEHAFDDFSGEFRQEGSPEASNSASVSVELGRGNQRQSPRVASTRLYNSRTDSQRKHSNMDNNSLYDITATPQNKPRTSLRKVDSADRSTLKREAQLRSASRQQQENLEGNFTKEIKELLAGTDRPKSTLAQSHARVTMEEDASIIDERPPTVSLNLKTTRFNNPRSRQTSGVGNETATTPNNSKHYASPFLRTPANGTIQSFVLPDIPNLTELVSGAYKEGTPVFSCSGKIRSRFAPAPDADAPHHNSFEDIPVPQDEKVLIASLKLLSDKFARLEEEKLSADDKVDRYGNKIIKLEAELDVLKRPDSTLGSPDGDFGKSAWKTEKANLQRDMEVAQKKLERVERRLECANSATKKLTEERDALLTQLEVAFMGQGELKAENEQLRVEIRELRKNNQTKNAHFEGEVQELRKENRSLQKKNAQFESEIQQFRKENQVLLEKNEQFEDETRQLRLDRKQFAKVRKENDTLQAEYNRVQAQQENLRKENDTLRGKFDMIQSKHEEDTQRWTTKEIKFRTAAAIQQHAEEKRARVENREQQRYHKALKSENNLLRERLEDIERRLDNVQKLPAMSEVREETIRRLQDDTIDFLYNNRVNRNRQDFDRVAKSNERPNEDDRLHTLRNLEERLRREREERTQESRAQERPQTRRAQSLMSSTINHEKKTTQTVELPKEVTEISEIDPAFIANIRKQLEAERAAKRTTRSFSAPANHLKEDTVHSVKTRASSRRTSFSESTDDPEENAPSLADFATNLPEFTATQQKEKTERSILSESTRRRRSAPPELTSAFILPDITMRNPHSLSTHNKKNCTLCLPKSNHDNIDIPDPVPVSLRTSDQPDATIRPVQPPMKALASVLKTLEDELEHLHIQLAGLHQDMRDLDPSCGMREHNEIQRKLRETLRSIEVRQKQIYTLYDVVEVCKDDDKEITGKIVEETLQSIGLDPVELLGREGGRGEDGETEEKSWRGFSSEDAMFDLHL